MAMTLSSPQGEDDEVIATINTTPLVDVMLVLLIIFLITSPAVIKTIPIKLPAERNQILKTKPENITLAITKEGKIYWNQSPVASNDALFERLKNEVSLQVPQPEVHIRSDQQTRYEFIGRAMLTVQRAGIAKVSFITEPSGRSK